MCWVLLYKLKTNVASFVPVGLYYKWFCVLSFCQCVKELEEEQPAKQDNLDLLASDFKHIANISDRLQDSQHQVFTSYWGLEAVYNLRNRDYQYGNLPKPAF